MYGYIYKTTNLVNNKIYIGQHKADQFNVTYFGSGKSLLNAINKYGKENFICEILEWCETQSKINSRERYWIKFYNSRDRNIGYNITEGGEGWKGGHHSEYTKQKISKAKTGCHPNRDYVITEETRQKISRTLKAKHQSSWNKGVPMREISKQKLREVNIGKKLSEETKQKMKGRKAWNKGIPMTEEAKQHLREINTGKKSNMSIDAKQRMSRRFTGENNPNYGGLKDETKEKIRQAILGRVWITNDIINKQVKKEELDYYLSIGYRKGRCLQKDKY